MMMNFMVYGFGLFAFWVCGFALQMGGVAPVSMLGGSQPSELRAHDLSLGKTWGIFGTHGFFLSGISYDVSVMVVFLFQMVFMDTRSRLSQVRQPSAGSTLPLVFVRIPGCDHLSTVRQTGHGAAGWLSQLGANFGLGHGYADFAGLAWSIRWAVSPRWRWQ